MASALDLGKCSASRGASSIILCLECSPNIQKARSKTKRINQYTMLRRRTHFYINNWSVHFADRAFRIFHNGWFDDKDAFMFFSIYNTA